MKNTAFLKGEMISGVADGSLIIPFNVQRSGSTNNCCASGPVSVLPSLESGQTTGTAVAIAVAIAVAVAVGVGIVTIAEAVEKAVAVRRAVNSKCASPFDEFAEFDRLWL